MPIDLPDEQASAWLLLLRAPGVGSMGLRELLGRHGSASAIVRDARGESRIPEAARMWLAAPDRALIERDLAWLQHRDHHLLVWDGADYPPLLRNVHNAPAALFVSGDPTHLWAAQIAIVGARSASAAGLANARSFAKAFVQSGNVITSGLAEGIDGAAHAAALDAGGVTIAVLGTGPDLIYPRQHEDLAARIVANGALVTEFPPGTAGKPEHFPRRNRIIAGMSLGTLVIEASLNSGSLITARFAAEQGHEVFALPGSIHSPLARGCHKLIRDGAKLIETADEVLNELHGMGTALADSLRQRLTLPEAPMRAATSSYAHDPDYSRLLAAMTAAPATMDELVERTGLPASALSSMLLVLELDGIVSENGRCAQR
ncbi:MAG: DNA-processing protein DprA [Rudaea sp.]|nr:DNA-processing protein DprA [Rudaea sp.]